MTNAVLSGRPARANRKLAAALAVSTAACLTSGQDVVIKWISGDYPFHEMQTIRCGVALLLLMVYLAATDGFSALRHGLAGLAGLRGLVFSAASVLFYLTAVAMPFAEAVALYFTMPLVIAALAGPLLGEPTKGYQWIAVVAGFAGVAVMTQPGARVFDPAALLGLASATLYAIGNLMTRPLGARVAAAPLAVTMGAIYFLSGGLLSLLFGWGGLETDAHKSLAYLTRPWRWPSANDAAIICGLGVATGILMILYTHAYRLAESSFVAPFEYGAMFWAVLFSFLLLGEWPLPLTFAGMGLVIGAGLFMLLADSVSAPRRPRGRL